MPPRGHVAGQRNPSPRRTRELKGIRGSGAQRTPSHICATAAGPFALPPWRLWGRIEPARHFCRDAARADVGIGPYAPTEAIVLIVGARIARPLGGGARALSPNASQSLPCVRGGGAQRRKGCNAVLVNFRVNPPVSLAADSSGLPRNLPGPRCGPSRPVAAGPLGSLFLPQTALPCGPFTQGGLWCGG